MDRTHQSKQTARLLKLIGVQVEVHRAHFAQDAPDDQWIPVCAAKGWVIVTGDQGIENDGLNRAVVIRSAAKIFTLYCHKSQSLEMTAALITARKKIARTALNNVGPFYCPIEMVGDTHVGKPKFYPGGYAIAVESVPESSLAVNDDIRNPSHPRHRKSKKGNGEMLNFS